MFNVQVEALSARLQLMISDQSNLTEGNTTQNKSDKVNKLKISFMTSADSHEGDRRNNGYYSEHDNGHDSDSSTSSGGERPRGTYSILSLFIFTCN